MPKRYQEMFSRSRFKSNVLCYVFAETISTRELKTNFDTRELKTMTQVNGNETLTQYVVFRE